MGSEHIYRFTKTGKPSLRFFKKRVAKEKRIFPKFFNDYVSEYYKVNEHIIRFVLY